MDNRYQHQPRHIKLYRWLRWRPYWAIKATWVILKWLLSGARISEDYYWCKSRWGHVKFLWRIHRSLADCSMRHIFTMEEVMQHLRLRVAEAPTHSSTSTTDPLS
jgi:hypothetical protein